MMYTHPDEILNTKDLYVKEEGLDRRNIVEEKQSELLEVCNDQTDQTGDKIDKE